MYSIATITAPTGEPLTRVEAKQHCRIHEEIGNDDSYFDALIAAARAYVEYYTERQLMTATYDLTLDGFPGNGQPLYIPKAPLVSITHVKYLAESTGTETTWTSSYYRVQLSEPGRVSLALTQTYPLLYGVAGQVTVRFICGYGTAADVPKGLKQAMLLLIGHWYDNREEVGKVGGKIEVAAHALMSSYRYGTQFWRYG